MSGLSVFGCEFDDHKIYKVFDHITSEQFIWFDVYCSLETLFQKGIKEYVTYHKPTNREGYEVREVNIMVNATSRLMRYYREQGYISKVRYRYWRFTPEFSYLRSINRGTPP